MQNHNLTIPRPVLSLSLYVIFSLGCKSQSDHPAACVVSQVWVCDLLTRMQNHSDHPAACVVSQWVVCDLLTWMQNHNLTIPRPVSSLRMYFVRDLLTWMQNHNLTIPWPVSSLRRL
ncbi:hypothetical protein PILCRDRAFT_453601 [Piloderma croceum F 1598]|uniref:Uncharacterized protein n=1 Tax=Piloderma croceum (strain F 1598) TaxID=765440 RepID=A0A0C3BZ80_PILCF|nr:hypothetical protein PILCRDRAFT_453601 [Piloderma croceum F 1598]